MPASESPPCSLGVKQTSPIPPATDTVWRILYQGSSLDTLCPRSFLGMAPVVSLCLTSPHCAASRRKAGVQQELYVCVNNWDAVSYSSQVGSILTLWDRCMVPAPQCQPGVLPASQTLGGFSPQAALCSDSAQTVLQWPAKLGEWGVGFWSVKDFCFLWVCANVENTENPQNNLCVTHSTLTFPWHV